MKRGVGLLSLIMYVIGLTIVIAIVTTFNYNILDATNTFTDIARLNDQYTKFNMFLVNTVKSSSYAKYGMSDNIIVFYNKNNDIVATYTYDSTGRKMIYTDSNEFSTGFEICLFLDDSFEITLSNVFETDKYSKISIGGSPMFELNQNTASFANIEYVIGRGY